MTQKLYELTEEGHELVDDAFMRGDPELTTDEIESVREPLDSEADLASLRAELEDAMARFPRGEAKLDAAVAEVVHRRLDLTRQQAANSGLWRYLAVVEFPDFVRHRWPYPDPDGQRTANSMREKFLEGATDLYANAFVRIWWIAELTHDGGDYSTTETALGNQELANDVFDRTFARYPPAVRACVEELDGAPGGVISDVTRDLNHALSTIRLEALTESELREMVSAIREKAERGTVT